MPLINGQKMACEPCIRGHRSTKCNHANERLMVPVRKPGRPLSSCPHPSTKPCSCGQVTAAIPRKQKCSCGPSTPGTQNGAAENGDSAMDAATQPSPPSTVKAPSSNFRVQKSRRASTRKQSIDPTSMERTDKSQLNIIPVANGLNGAGAMSPSEATSPMSALSQYGTPGISSVDQQLGAHPFMFPMLPQPMPNQMFNQPARNGHMPMMTNGADSSGNASQQPSGGCCGSGAKPKRDGDDTALFEGQHASRHNSVSNGPDGNMNGGIKKKSCCSSKTEHIEPETSAAATPSGAQANAGAMVMPQFPTPMATPPNMFPFFAHPGIFTYPPQYGTFMQPLQPDQWRQMMAAFNYGQLAQQHAYDMVNASLGNGMVAPAAALPTHPQGLEEAKSGGTSHHCSCGQACQCVGCATHPYNEATQNYIRSACHTMMEGQNHQHEAAAVGNGDLSNGHGSEHGSSTSHTPPGASAHSTIHVSAEGSITAPQTPSDAPSGLSEEQTLSASDFFFVTYPFGDSCAGESASCPCGDDCQCIGCVIHSNPDPSQPIDQHS